MIEIAIAPSAEKEEASVALKVSEGRAASNGSARVTFVELVKAYLSTPGAAVPLERAHALVEGRYDKKTEGACRVESRAKIGVRAPLAVLFDPKRA